MKLVLINSPIQKYSKEYKPEYRTTAPLGLGYLGTIARRNGIETTLIDAEAEKLTVDETAEKVNNFAPDVVGINMASTNYKLSLEILGKIQAPHKLIGGPHATLKGNSLTGNHLIVRGEAEDILLDILQKRNGIVNAGVIENLDRLPFIDRTLFVNDPYSIDGKLESAISTTRGCPYSCVFCCVPVINGRKVRARSVKNVVEEIKELKERGVNSIHFIDDLFNYDRKRLEDFCNTLIEQEINITWKDLSRIELLDGALLEKMKESGCYKLAFGLESGTKRILEYIGKCTDLNKVRNIIKKCSELGIETKGFFTIGYPDEAEEDIKRTIDFSQELGLTEAYYMVVRAFPGTKMFKEMRKYFSEEQLEDYYQFNGKGDYIKYHVMNSQSLNGIPNKRLDGYVREAYEKFYKGKNGGIRNENLLSLQT